VKKKDNEGKRKKEKGTEKGTNQVDNETRKD
jgi:hypothetical protein